MNAHVNEMVVNYATFYDQREKAEDAYSNATQEVFNSSTKPPEIKSDN